MHPLVFHVKPRKYRMAFLCLFVRGGVFYNFCVFCVKKGTAHDKLTLPSKNLHSQDTFKTPYLHKTL